MSGANASDANGSFHCRTEPALADVAAIKVALVAAYSLVFAVAVSGNALVVYVVAKNRAMQTVTNLFICNLAASDMLVNFTSLWLTPVYSYMSRWVWGAALCHALPLFQGTSIFISTLTLTAIAVDRYIVILHPFRQRISVPFCLAVVASIWLFSLLAIAPYAIHMRLWTIRHCGFQLCREMWPWKQLQTVYGFIVMCLQFVVPFLAIGLCYVRIWWQLRQRRSLVTGRNSVGELQRKRRLHRMLVAMVVIFALCWLPLNALNLFRDLGFVALIRKQFSLYFLVTHLIAMSATCWNPILYAWMNDNFRNEFRAALPCFSRAPRPSSGASLPSVRNTSGVERSATPTARLSDMAPRHQNGRLLALPDNSGKPLLRPSRSHSDGDTPIGPAANDQDSPL